MYKFLTTLMACTFLACVVAVVVLSLKCFLMIKDDINTGLQDMLVVNSIEQTYPSISRPALIAGVRAYENLLGKYNDPQHLLTIVNFNRPSNEKRLWVIDIRTGLVLYHTYVAQGQNTGLNVAKHFSNVIGSHESSIGVYLTGHTYYGHDGLSLRLHGLDKGFNNNVFKRYIVMHPAWYVSKTFAEQHGRIGRTYGCFGLGTKIAPKIIKLIKDGTVMVAYYPNKHWLDSSPYEQPVFA